MSSILRSLTRRRLLAAAAALLLSAGLTGLAVAQTPTPGPAAPPLASRTPGTPGTPAPGSAVPVATIAVPPTFGPAGQPPAAGATRPPNTVGPTQVPPSSQSGAGASVPGSVEITLPDNGKTFTVPVGQTVVVRLGTDLNWTVTVDPVALLPRAPGVNTLVRGVQGIFRAAAPGTVTVNGEGRPQCNPGQVCAQFIEAFMATVVITPAAATPAAPVQQAPQPTVRPAPPAQPARPAPPPAQQAQSPAPGAAAARPVTIAALPNTGVGSPDQQGHAWETVAIVVLLCGTLLGAGVIRVRPRM